MNIEFNDINAQSFQLDNPQKKPNFPTNKAVNQLNEIQIKSMIGKEVKICWQNCEKGLEELNNVVYDNSKLCATEYGKLIQLIKSLE